MKLLLLFSIAICTICPLASADGIKTYGRADSSATPVSFIMLLANPEEYSGKRIRVYAVLLTDFEGMSLVWSREQAEIRDPQSAISYSFDLDSIAPTQEQLQPFHKRYVLIEGKFIATVYPNGEVYRHIDKVTRLELREPLQTE